VNESGKGLYEKVKKKIEVSQEEGTLEKQFGDFWKFACVIKTRQHDLRYLYDDTSREFVDKNRDKLIEMREDFVDNIESYVEQCINIMRKKNFIVHYAKTNEEAQKIFMEELGDNRIIYKSKSNQAKDIGIIDVLKKNEIIIKETDLGDVLVQLFEYKLPSL